MAQIQILAGLAVLSGDLTIPENARSLVLFAHGSGSSRHSPRNQFVASTLNRSGLGTLLFDLLTPEEEALDLYTRKYRFNIGLLAERLVQATNWSWQQEQTRDFRVGYFGSSTAGALQHWWQQLSFHRTLERLFLAADVPIWLAMPCQKSWRRRCSSLAAMTTSS
jgi:putative phosphoribosyl transferase